MAALLFLLAVAGLGATAAEIDLREDWDDRAPLANPHKGWYHHFPDNHIKNYAIARDADLTEFPGMDHLYIRLAWAYLEPREGQFNWPIIDDIIQKWTKLGLGISFRISCRETSTDRLEQQFATPKWVMEAGAKGGYYRAGKEVGPDGPWEPVFDDPVFLEKLDRFLKAFAVRYDGRPWVRYVDIGSIGDWGEGHCWAGSRKKYGYEQRRTHIDLHLKYFKKSQLTISDDFVYEVGGPEERQRLHRYVVDHGISYRDDSILVDGYFAGHSASATVRSEEFFADVFKTKPTVLELEHYGAVKRGGNWLATPGSSIAKYAPGKTGADLLRDALGRLRATYIGYHGYAQEWLPDNPELTNELLNRCGYWYFPHRASIPWQLKPGETQTFQLAWENRGVAPAYIPFQLLVRLENDDRKIDLSLPAENTRWMPGTVTTNQVYALTLPASTSPGAYQFKIKLRSPEANRDVAIAVKKQRLDGAGFYNLGTVKVSR